MSGTVLRNTDLVAEIQKERRRNAERACIRDAGQNRAIRAFLVERGADAEALATARRFFPVRSRAECAQVAREQVNANP